MTVATSPDIGPTELLGQFIPRRLLGRRRGAPRMTCLRRGLLTGPARSLIRPDKFWNDPRPEEVRMSAPESHRTIDRVEEAQLFATIDRWLEKDVKSVVKHHDHGDIYPTE